MRSEPREEVKCPARSIKLGTSSVLVDGAKATRPRRRRSLGRRARIIRTGRCCLGGFRYRAIVKTDRGCRTKVRSSGNSGQRRVAWLNGPAKSCQVIVNLCILPHTYLTLELGPGFSRLLWECPSLYEHLNECSASPGVSWLSPAMTKYYCYLLTQFEQGSPPSHLNQHKVSVG